MCGITGFFLSAPQPDSARHLQRMSDAIRHRGPDQVGLWSDEAVGIFFGHRRLSIVDLSMAGSQPMHSASGRFTICFNGEIYNHRQLRQRLQSSGLAPQWRGESDTETVTAALDAWGLEATLNCCVGMFAFALWDHQQRALSLCRDRFGEKPMYYTRVANGAQQALLFGSELKALRAHPMFRREVDRMSVAELLRRNCIGGTHTIYRGVRKLPPGSLMTLSDWSAPERPRPYWSVIDALVQAKREPFRGTLCDAADELERLLGEALDGQMMADVPLGAFLSGGVDSSAIVALMQKQASRPVKTFSIGFGEASHNEAPYAAAVARHLGTEHTELVLSASDALAVIPKLPTMYCEPFADSSQIPTYLLSAMTRRHVTVSLSGDAGDEVFCGYNRYRLTASAWQRVHKVPAALRRALARGLAAVPPAAWDRLAFLTPYAQLGHKVHKGADVVGSRDMEELYFNIVSRWKETDGLILGLDAVAGHGDEVIVPPGLNDIETMMALDTQTYLVDDILVKVDRAAMATSLETRVPFLDPHVFAFAWSLPLDYKLHEGTTKRVLREVLYRHVPRELIERPKMGFGIPLGHWLRGPLRDWAEELLSEQRLTRQGFLRAEPIRRKWSQHLAGRHDWQEDLWSVLMFQAWLANEEG